MRTTRRLAIIALVGCTPIACDGASTDDGMESPALSTAPGAGTAVASGSSENGATTPVPGSGSPSTLPVVASSPQPEPVSSPAPLPTGASNPGAAGENGVPTASGGVGGTAGGNASGIAGAGNGAFAGAGTGGATLGDGGAGMDGGASGAGLGGTGGTPGTPEDWLNAAEVLDGFAILKPCVSSFQPSGNANNQGDCCCEEEAQYENQRETKTFGGDPNVTYQVTVRIAGVAERYWYDGGQTDSNSELFYIGGLPTIHGPAANEGLAPGEGACKIHPPETDGQFALPFEVPVEVRPEDGCYNGFNIFAMTVSAPKQSYYLNATQEFDGADRQPHSAYTNDYTVTIPIQGQAELTFYTIDGDHHQVTNNGTMSVPDVTTPQPYNGNFLEFTVVDVVPAP